MTAALIESPVPIGERIGPNLIVRGVLGAGGMGVVLLAEHETLRQTVAVKVLLRKSEGSALATARFLREARAAAQLANEHVVRVLDSGKLPDGAPYLVMERLRGKTLAEVLSETGPLDPEDAKRAVLHACRGIAEAHALGIVHRDLKPSNLFLTHRLDGEPLVKVLDFGIAKVEPDEHDDGTLTSADAVLGSVAYMSPEQVMSARDVDESTDIWSLGVVLFELLTGSLPFEAASAAGLGARITGGDAPLVSSRRAGLSPGLDRLVARCLRRVKAERFSSVEALAEALEKDENADEALPAEAPLPNRVEPSTLADAPSSLSFPGSAPSKSRAPVVAAIALGIGAMVAIFYGTSASKSASSRAPSSPAAAVLPAPTASTTTPTTDAPSQADISPTSAPTVSSVLSAAQLSKTGRPARPSVASPSKDRPSAAPAVAAPIPATIVPPTPASPRDVMSERK